MPESDTPAFEIREAVAADYDDVVRVWNESGLPTKTTGRDGREAVERQLRAFPGSYLVAEVGGQIVGVVLGSHDGRKGWINRLAVVPSHRRLGIGLALAEACDAALRTAGMEIVAAMVEEGNDASERLFRRMGYRSDVAVTYLRKLDRPDA